jgi:hypothetical protein
MDTQSKLESAQNYEISMLNPFKKVNNPGHDTH